MCLEVDVEADAEAVVGTGIEVDLGSGCSLGSYLAVAIEGVHIAEVNIEILRGMNTETAAEAVAGQIEGDVVHVGIDAQAAQTE